MSKTRIQLIYDGECPVCQAYSRVVRIRHTVGELEIIDAREASEALAEITELKLDIDQGMVVRIGDQFYYGADAMHALSLISTRSGVFNRFNYWLFRSKSVSRLLYPVLRSCRNLLLRFLGKTKINNLELPEKGDR